MRTKEELDAYLARIRKTIADSKSLVSQVELRMSETDRLLESQGLTREKVRQLRFTPEQLSAANRELERQGIAPLEAYEEPVPEPVAFEPPPVMAEPPVMDDELANRRMKFSMMMKPFRI